MSIIWQLPEDILHRIYSEWLEWKDLSMLDIACVKKNERELWLTSLSDLKMTQTLATNNIFWNVVKMRVFYKWLRSHRVFWVEGFVVMVDALEVCLEVLDVESFCPALHSIEIDRFSNDKTIPDIVQLESNLSLFLSHCHNLREITTRMGDMYEKSKYLYADVLSVLVEKLRENSLVKISLLGIIGHHESHVEITSLLLKHASSLQEFTLSQTDGMELIMSTLIENQIRLRVLNVDLGYEPSDIIPYLISYISSAGDLLEDLKVENWPYNVDKLVLSVSASCPKLIRLEINSNGTACSVTILRQLFEQCPYLQDVSIDKTIFTDDGNMSVTIEVKGSNDDWAVCLSHALRRRRYEQVTLRLRVDYYHPVENLKSMLEPYFIELFSKTNEASLISLLHDLPHLNRLDLKKVTLDQYTDAALSAIAEHAKSLTELGLIYDIYDYAYSIGRSSYDMQLSKLIKTCQLLRKLNICCCGWDSLVAISNHSTLKMITLTTPEDISMEMLDGLLLDEKVKWPSTLEEGCIHPCLQRFAYDFNMESHRWIKHGRNLVR
eukprot:scaffold1206_cov184-Ochromonas_danica.AAC.7